MCDGAVLFVPASGHIDRLINPSAGAVWRIYRRGNRVGHAGQWKGKTDSSRSIKQRANNKCVRDGCAAAINVKSIISQGARRSDHNRALHVMTENMLQPTDHTTVFHLQKKKKTFHIKLKQVDGGFF